MTPSDLIGLRLSIVRVVDRSFLHGSPYEAVESTPVRAERFCQFYSDPVSQAFHTHPPVLSCRGSSYG